jgi:hypothetical protein
MQSPSCKYPASPNYIAYTTKIESFQRIAFNPAWTASGGWYIWTKTGTKMTYEARVSNPALGVFAWNLARVEDTLGNKVTYSYWHDGSAPNWGEEYIYAIIYNGTLVKFYYESRPIADVLTYAIGGDLVTIRYRLKAIDVQIGNSRIRAYALKYSESSGTNRSLLESIQQFGTDAIIDNDAILCANVASGCQYGAVTGGTALPAFQLQAQNDNKVEAWRSHDRSDPTWGLPQDGGPLPGVFNGVAYPKIAGTCIYDSADCTFPILNYTGDFDGDGQSDWVDVDPKLQGDGPK